jgi:hypothetical protein
MAVVFSSKAAALVALFAVLVLTCASYGDAAGWLPAKATWYGRPDGAGPDDNGTY